MSTPNARRPNTRNNGCRNEGGASHQGGAGAVSSTDRTATFDEFGCGPNEELDNCTTQVARVLLQYGESPPRRLKVALCQPTRARRRRRRVPQPESPDVSQSENIHTALARTYSTRKYFFCR
ncbi:unnamed protein product [Ectocarpus sp. 4 AP-2014]